MIFLSVFLFPVVFVFINVVLSIVADVAVEKSITDAKESKTKVIPKIHNNEPVEENDKKSAVNLTRGLSNENQKDLACKFCDKVLGSSSSLERHLLVHSGERPFRCKMCDLTFNTNGNMHRHMRSHKQNHDSDSEDSEASSSANKATSPSRIPNTRKRRMEYNNNSTGGHSADDEQTPGAKRKTKNINNNFINDVMTAQSLVCPVCDNKEFPSLNVFEIHMEKMHPDYQVKCISCNLNFKTQRILNLHRYMVHHTERKDSSNKKAAANSISGFKDCTFIDFSSQKFPQIAKTVCEQSVHKSITEQKFRCGQCSRDFPCESALDIHKKACFATSSGESEDYAKRRRESSSTDEEIRRDDFFANLDLQNKSPNYAITPRPIVEVRKSNDYYAFNKEIIRPLVDNSKDLADIQSILSVTSAGGLLEQLTQKSHETSPMTPDHNNRGADEHEEVQDIFAAEFRKMKLRGEFPCRLCTAIFPNLRALKGHNRVHLSGNGPGPYRCNMCPHSSLDKAALVRHMRTHNGDRPYECAVCNYAFTTKANCERHLRNRHSKVTREDVKRSIIYHPSEDPNNDEVNSKLNISREEIKRSIIFTTPENEHREDAERLHNDRSTPVTHFVREPAIAFKDRNLTIPSLPRDLSIVIPQPRDILRAHCSIEAVSHNVPLIQEESIQPRLKVKLLCQLTQIPEFHECDPVREPDSEDEIEAAEESYPIKPINYSSEVPMDLSTGECQEDVLDLSKKRIDKVEEVPVSDAETENYIPKTIESNNNHTAAMFEKTQLFLAQQQLLKEAHLQKMDPAASFYANQLSQLYRTGAAFPGLGLPPAFPLNHFHFLQHNPYFSPPTNPKELAEIKEKIQKEIIRGLQLSGGAIVGMEQHNIVSNMALATERLQAFHQQALNNTASPDIKPHTPAPIIKVEEDVKPPLHINTDTPSTIPYSNPIMSSPKIHKKEAVATHSPNSVKMVIKNGVLMPKQKQRRYRTERPFSCEHCSARFTLRSNMERHIKQQHPQYWSQRQRSNIGMPRKNPVSLVPQNITVPSLNYESRLNYIKNLHPNSDLPNNSSNSGEDKDNSSNHSSGIPNKTYSMISDQVKYAILAQQLKSHNNYSQPKNSHSRTEILVAENEEDEADEDDTLVIDEEESVDDKAQVVKDLQVKTIPENTQTLADANLLAKKVAQEILIGVSAKTQHPDISKDFDWKIAGSLISKNPQHHTTPAVIPTFVSQIGQSEDIDVGRSESDNKESKQEEGDLVSVSRLLDNASAQIPFGKYFKNEFSASAEMQPRHDSSIQHQGEGSEEDEEGLVASSGSTSEGNNSGSDENR